MTRFSVALAALVVSAAAAILWMRAPSRPAPASSVPPDVVLVTIDTLRADHLGSYGYAAARTPTLDRLAADGVRFARAIAPTPLTLPSHASILTAVAPTVHGVRDNIGFALSSTLPTVAERFSAAGYRSAAFVSAFPLQSRFGLSRGFAHYDDRLTAGGDKARPAAVERPAQHTVDAVRDWLAATSGDQRPFFLWVHLFDPHAPYVPPEPLATQFRDRPYDGEIAFVDAQLARLLEDIAQHRGGRPLLTTITADHGEGLGEHAEPTHGLFIYDTTIRVPLILYGSGVPSGRIVETQVRLLDVAPTLLDLANVAALPDVQGESLRALFDADRPAPHRTAYSESLSGRLCCGWAPLHGLRDGRFTMIEAPRPELYDTVADPQQLRNIADAAAEPFARLQAALRTAINEPAKPATASASDVKRLASLGYLSAGSGQDGLRPSLRDPKDMADVAARLGRAIERADAEPAIVRQELEALAQADPENPLIRRHLVRTRVRSGDPAGARRELAALLAKGDRSPETLELSADLAIAAGDLQAARQALEALYEKSQDDESGLKLGIVLMRLRQTEPAIDIFRGIVARSPHHVEALVDLGGALLQARRSGEAAEVFERAVTAGAAGPLALNGLATARLANGDKAGAAAALRDSLRAEPNQPQVQAMLKELER